MTVTVAWPVGKRRGDNHEPQFRSPGSDRLEGKETTIARLVYEAYNLMDPAWNASVALGRISEGVYQTRIERALEELTEALQKVLYEAHAAEMEEMAGRIRDSINRDLRRLGSPVRLAGPRELKKAQVTVGWGELAPRFNVAPANSTSLVYSQFRTGQIVTFMGTEQVGMIRGQIAQAFTQVQQWSGGRITTGLTPQQVSGNLFSLLAQTTPAQMELSAAQVAAYRSGYTNGLFPAWAKAVNNFGDRTATELANRGISGDRARTMLDKRTQRYGDKLRRARSRMIARTEIAKVQNAAMQATIDSAYSDGLIGNRAQKVWVTGPFDVCDICQPMSGRRVPYNGYFQWKNGSGPYGPAHPNCRCIIRMVPNLNRAPERTGQGTIGNPFRYRFPDGWEAPITPVRGAPGVAAPTLPLPPPPPPPAPAAPPPQPAPSGLTRPEGRSIGDDLQYPSSKRSREVVEEFVNKYDEVLAAPEPLPGGLALDFGSTGENVAGWFSPRHSGPKPRAPNRPSRYQRGRVLTDDEYDAAVEEYRRKYEVYRTRYEEWRDVKGARIRLKSKKATVGDQQNTLTHEYGHRIDAAYRGQPGTNTFKGHVYRTDEAIDAGRAASSGPWQDAALDRVAQQHRPMLEFLQTAAKSDALQEAQTVLTAQFSTARATKYITYLRNPQEMWARAFNQWFSMRHGSKAALDDMLAEISRPNIAQAKAGERAWFGVQWRAKEFEEKIAPLVEAVLKEMGLLA